MIGLGDASSSGVSDNKASSEWQSILLKSNILKARIFFEEGSVINKTSE